MSSEEGGNTDADGGTSSPKRSSRLERTRKERRKRENTNRLPKDRKRSAKTTTGGGMAMELLFFYLVGLGVSIAFGGGFVTRFSPEWATRSSLVALIAPIALTLFYCLWGLGRRHHTGSKAREFADNCYFLGFLYTLTFLFIAFGGLAISPDAELSSRDIIEKFSIALGSTVVGLLLRTLISNNITDIDEHVDEVKNQLAKYASSVESAAGEVVEHIANLGSNVSTLGNSVAGFVETAKKSGSAVEKNFNDLLEINGRVTSALEGAKKSFGQAVGEVVTQAGGTENAVSMAIGNFKEQLSNLSGEIRDTSLAAVQQMGAQSDVVRTAADSLATAPNLIRTMKAATTQNERQYEELKSAMETLSGAVDRFNVELADLELAPSGSGSEFAKPNSEPSESDGD